MNRIDVFQKVFLFCLDIIVPGIIGKTQSFPVRRSGPAKKQLRTVSEMPRICHQWIFVTGPLPPVPHKVMSSASKLVMFATVIVVTPQVRHMLKRPRFALRRHFFSTSKKSQKCCLTQGACSEHDFLTGYAFMLSQSPSLFREFRGSEQAGAGFPWPCFTASCFLTQVPTENSGNSALSRCELKHKLKHIRFHELKQKLKHSCFQVRAVITHTKT